MRPKHWLTCSIALNGLLLCAVLAGGRRAVPLSPPTSAADVRTNPPVRPLRADAHEPETVTVQGMFHWSQIESAHYATYVKNLRAMGCPEVTVRDIIVADVDDLYRGRVQNVVDTVQNRFWELVADKASMEKMVDEKAKALHELAEERETLLTELLGEKAAGRTWETEANDLEQLQARTAQLDFLAPDKVAACLALEDGFTRQREAVQRLQPPLSADQRKERLKALEADQERQLRQLLSPADLSEYQLRRSSSADVRQRLTGFTATEEELKAIVQLRDQQQEKNTSTAAGEEALVKLLGKERFDEYRRAQDGRFEEFYRLTERLQMPSQVAAEAYEMRQAAEASAQQVRRQNEVAEAERQSLLKEIRAETERSLEQVFGETAFKAYRAQRGDWLRELEKAKL